MASHRIIKEAVVSSKVNWDKFRSLLPSSTDLTHFNSLKAKNDSYIGKVNSLPPSLPAINFDDYRRRLKSTAAIDHLEKLYQKVSISYPDQPIEAIAEIDASCAKSKEIVEMKLIELAESKRVLEGEKRKFANFPPVEEWNPEMWLYYFGDDACPNFAKLKTEPEVQLDRLLEANYKNL